MNERIFSLNIKRLRKLRGFSQAEIAVKAGLSRLAYLNIENGNSEPKSSTLLNIAKALEVDIQELFYQPKTFQSLRFRIGKNYTQKDKNIRQYEIDKFSRWLEHYNYLETELNCRTPYRLKSISTADPCETAAIARKTLGLNDKEPIIDICNLLDESGIKVYLYVSQLKNNFGMSLGEEDGGPVIAVNVSDSISIERQIFTAAHELGHLLLHRSSFRLDALEENTKEEDEANMFASYFLMPSEGFNRKWEETSGVYWTQRILHVKRIYKVSYLTILKRLIDLNVVDNTIYGRFAAEYKRNYGHDLKNYFEPDSLEEPDALSKNDFISDRLNRLVRNAYEKEIITLSKAAEILQIPLINMREIAGSWNF